jgi:predicted ATPase/class 3 adenylate cyclase
MSARPLPSVTPTRDARVQKALRALMPNSLATKVNAAAREIVGERREVTVLLLDLADFTAMTHMLDSEDVYLLTDEAMRLLAEVVYQYEGTIDKFTGDGLMALFGLPITHENDPERAVRAALEMHAALQPLRVRIQRQCGVDFRARIGIHTGLVIAGQVGSDLHVDYTVIGDTINLASHLQETADPGTVLVSFDAYQRTRPWFVYEALPPLTVRGKSRSIRAFRPLKLREKPGRTRGLPGLQVPMIGRQDALANLTSALNKVLEDRRSQIALVTGEAGVGKSRLLAEFHGSVDRSGVHLYQGSCSTYTRSTPLRLVANIIRDILYLGEADPAEMQRQALRAHIDQLEMTDKDMLPYLYNVLGLEQDDPRAEARLVHLDDATLQKLTHAALQQVFLSKAQLYPTVLVFEDLHWIDSASRDFLEHLIQVVDDVPLMMVLVSRDLERGTVVRPFIAAARKRESPLVDIQLSPLSRSDGKLLVDQLVPQVTDEAQSLKQRIVERADGNPFYAEEIVRVLIDQGGLIRQNDIWQVTPQARGLAEKVPGTLNGLIMARFDRLPEPSRRTLQKAAVLGSSFPLSLLQSLNGMHPESVTSQVAVLEKRQFLVIAPFGVAQGYIFRHALIQGAVYGTLLKRDRQKLHEQVAEAIELDGFGLPEERAEALAYHYAESAHPIRAIPYLISAAESAARRCAYETAIQHYRRVLTLMQSASTDHDESFLHAQIGLGRALRFVGEYAEANQVLAAALRGLLYLSLKVESTSLLSLLVHGLEELAEIRVREGSLDKAIDHLQAALNSMGDEGHRVHLRLWRSVINRVAWVRFRQGMLEEAFELASSATLGLDADHADDPMTLASLYNTLAGVLWQQGDLSEAVSYIERCLYFYRSLNYLWGMATTYTNLGILHYALGDWPKAAKDMERAETLQKQIGDIQNRAITLNNLGTLRQSMGDHEDARRDLETSLSLRQRLGDVWGEAQSHVSLARLDVVQSRLADATAHVKASLVVLDDAGVGAYGIEARWILALGQAEEDLEAGLASAEQALQMARTAGLSEQEADCRRVLGVLRARAGQYVEAESLLRESIDLCVQSSAPYGQGLALLELGRLYRDLARDGAPYDREEWRTKAFKTFQEASERFERLGAMYDFQIVLATTRQLETESVKEDIIKVAAGRETAAPQRTRLGVPEGEWRTAAIVWLSLTPAPGADEEDVFETLALTIPSLVGIAQEQGGQVIRRQDGLTVIFGAPTAYEDDPERAVQTAWQIVDYMSKTADQTAAFLTCGVAVSYGDVVAGQVGSRFHAEFMVQGEPVQKAQRISESAPPARIWVTEAVRVATERVFVFAPAPPHVAGHLADLSFWELAGIQERPSPARGLPGLKAKMIGRETPLQTMGDIAKNLNRGFGGLIWIEGEPGIGKSRLMREFAATIAETDIRLWSGKCSPQKSGNAFSLFSDLLSQALGVQPASTPSEIRTVLDQTYQIWPRDAQMTRPYLEVLLGVWPEGMQDERLASLAPEQLRQQTFVSLRRLFKSMTRDVPLAIFLDDLHWMDPISGELLQFLLPLVASASILFVCAQRRQGSDLPNERLVRIQSLIPRQTVRLLLNRLSKGESEVLLGELLPRAKFPAVLRTSILTESEGNPYFIEEYVRMLVEQDYLLYRDDRWEVNPNLDPDDVPLPSSLETLILSRLDALPSELKQLVQCAAVIGAPFEANLLQSVSELPNVQGDLGRLETRLLVVRGDKADLWHFGHSLIEGVAYNSMLRARRRALHLDVAQTLETRWAGAEAEHAEELAYHFARAEKESKALPYLVLAGERAATRYANEEAQTYFEQAAQILEARSDVLSSLRWRVTVGLGDTYHRTGEFIKAKDTLKTGLSQAEVWCLSATQQAGLHWIWGETARKQGELEEARQQYVQALDILGKPDDRSAQTAAARALTGLGMTCLYLGDIDEARRSGEASLSYARDADALGELAMAENLMGGIYYRQSEWESAFHHTRRAMVLREQMGYTWGVASTLANLGVLAVLSGEWNKAASFFERSLVLRQEMGDVDGMALIHNNLGTVALDQGKLDVAEEHFEKSLELAKRFEMNFHVGNSTVGLAQVWLLQAKVEAAQEAITTAEELARAIGANDMLGEIYYVRAEILMAKSELDQARDVAQEAIDLLVETGNRSLEASTWRVVSEIELQRGDVIAARMALTKAKRLLVDATDELEAGRVAAQEGRIALHEGKFAQAEEPLRSAQQTFMRLGASLDLKRVEEVLRVPSV